MCKDFCCAKMFAQILSLENIQVSAESQNNLSNIELFNIRIYFVVLFACKIVSFVLLHCKLCLS